MVINLNLRSLKMSKTPDILDIKDKPKQKLFAKFTPKEQFQMSLIALGGMIILTFITGIYLFFFTEFSSFFRWLALINTMFGVLFLFSTFVGAWQSYQMVKLVDSGNAISQLLNASKDIQNLFNTNSTNPDEIKEIKKNVRGLNKDGPVN